MGLDMYLYANKSIFSFDKDGSTLGENIALLTEFPNIGEITSVTAEVGYWRKANHIHIWFVENVQDGVDDCKTYYVGRTRLNELKKLCRQVLDDPESGPSLLPTAKGFFFGRTEYDSSYLNALSHTINIIDNCLALSDDWDFEYASSW